MDQLISCLEKCALNESSAWRKPDTEFNLDHELELVIGQMTDARITQGDCDVEWEILSQNYSKLRYLCDIIEIFPKKTSTFYKSLDVFFLTIDATNQHYLRDIDWYYHEQSINCKCENTKYYLEQSLNTSDRCMKLKFILNAYSILVELGEYFRNEKYQDLVDDQEFLDEFNENCY
jgi:hypothetical protein